MPEAVWSSVVDWWSSSPRDSLGLNFIEVSIPDFAQRRAWLRENWTRLGYSVEIEDGVRDALRKVDCLMAQFDSIAAGEDTSDVAIDFSLIELERPLTDFQKSNIRALYKVPSGANFSVPGAGKTLTTLVLWEFFRISRRIEQLLVVCPRSAFEAWESDSALLSRRPRIATFSDQPVSTSTEILYLNYEQLESDLRLLRLVKWLNSRPSMLVIDEAHRIKGGGASIRWRACNQLARHAARVDLLTGTPMPQSQEDLRNLLSLSWPGLPREFFNDSRLRGLKRGGIFVRTTKRELQLPPMKINTVQLPMGRVQRDVYAALKNSFVGQFAMSNAESSYFQSRGKAVMTLIAAATNPGLLMRTISEDAYLGLSWPPKTLTGQERMMSVVRNYAAHEVPEKYQWVTRYVAKASAEGRKVLVWSTFIANLLALRNYLQPYDPALVYGSSSPEERSAELLKFRTSKSCSVLLSNPQTLGEGISLHNECHEAIYVDRSYNAGLYLQSLDRIHRLGLSKSQETNVFILQSEGSIDKRISRRLEDKIQRLGVYLDDEGLAKVSLPDIDEDVLPDSMSGLDEIDLNDIYKHLTENG